jgi:hypothetical protein
LGNVSQAPDHELERHLASFPSFRSRCFLHCEDFAKLYDRKTPLTAAAIM